MPGGPDRVRERGHCGTDLVDRRWLWPACALRVRLPGDTGFSLLIDNLATRVQEELRTSEGRHCIEGDQYGPIGELDMTCAFRGLLVEQIVERGRDLDGLVQQ